MRRTTHRRPLPPRRIPSVEYWRDRGLPLVATVLLRRGRWSRSIRPRPDTFVCATVDEHDRIVAIDFWQPVSEAAALAILEAAFEGRVKTRRDWRNAVELSRRALRWWDRAIRAARSA